MDYNEQESGMTLGEVFKVIFKKKWLLLAITLGIAIIGTLMINFVISKNQVEYKSEFSIKYPGVESSVYPDGTPFNYKDLVSADNLAKIKTSDDKFKNVDVEAIADNNDISIVEIVRTVNEEEVSTGSYTLTVKSKYFDSETVAKEFVTAIANYPVEYAKANAEAFDFSANLTSYTASNSYRSQIDYLVAQKNMLTSGYSTLISRYGEMYTVGDKRLKDYLSEINLYFSNNKIDTLYTELEDKGYISDDGYLDTVKYEIKDLEIEKEDNLKVIQNLKTELEALVKIYGTSGSSVVTYESFNSRIADLTERNVQIERQLKILNTYITNNPDGVAANQKELELFKKKLNTFYDQLVKDTASYTDVNKAIYNSVSKVTFANSSVIISEGGISLIIAIIGSLIGGFVVGCIINLIIDMPKYLREKKQVLKMKEQEAQEE